MSLKPGGFHDRAKGSSHEKQATPGAASAAGQECGP
jgi:hypothetical protein